MGKTGGWVCIKPGCRNSSFNDNNPIASRILCLVERGVCSFDEGVQCFGRFCFANADADRDFDAVSVGWEMCFHDSPSQAFGDGMGRMQVCFGEEHDELLAAVTSDQVCGARIVQAALCNLMKDLVANCMTETVINLFEMVDVEHQNAERAADAAGTLEFELAELE